MSEYGTFIVSGLHNDLPFMFTGKYQKEFLSVYHCPFDNVSSIIHSDARYFIGELVWNVFDFATEQNVKCVGRFHYKDIFT